MSMSHYNRLLNIQVKKSIATCTFFVLYIHSGISLFLLLHKANKRNKTLYYRTFSRKLAQMVAIGKICDYLWNCNMTTNLQ